MSLKTEATTSVPDVESTNEIQNDVNEEQEKTTSRPQQVQHKKNEQDEEDRQLLRHRSTLRACAVCVKEIALPSPDDEEDLEDEMMENLSGGVRKIRLREIKTLERKKQEELDRQRQDRRGRKEDGDDTYIGEEDVVGRGIDVDFENHDTVSGAAEGDDDEDDDPFLKAVGGSDKLLTGDAYRQKILLEQQQK